jgi:hypothetical protein
MIGRQGQLAGNEFRRCGLQRGTSFDTGGVGVTAEIHLLNNSASLEAMPEAKNS